jgi:hypothetical protein
MTEKMEKILSWKTLLSTLIGLGMAGSLSTLPVEAGDEGWLQSATEAELMISQFSERNGNQSESAVGWKNLVGLAGLAVGTSVVGYHLLHASRPSQPTLKGSTSILDRVNPKLRRELLRLVHDPATATRLLAGTLTSHPGRSPNWVAEKVIYDLKRDR